MPPIPQNKEKSNDTEATKMIRAADSLEKQMPVQLGGDDLIGAIAAQISSKTARAAQNTADTMLLESEIENAKKKSELDTLRSPPKSVQPTPMFGGFGGAGSGGGRAAIVQTIINSIPEDRRASFIEQNKEALLGESNSGLFALAGKAQQGNGGGNGHNDGLGTAALISAISEMQERSLLTAQRLLPQQQPQTQPQQGQLGAVELITFMKDMQMSQMQMMNNIANQFTTAMQSVQQGYREQQEKHSADLNLVREQMMAAQKESIEKDKLYLMQKVEELQSQPTTPANVLTLNHLPMIKQALAGAGMEVSSATAMQEGDRRKWDLEDKKLDMSKEDKDRAFQMQLEEKRLEAEKAKSRTAAFGALVGLVAQAYNGARVSKALSNGSPNAVAVGGRFSE